MKLTRIARSLAVASVLAFGTVAGTAIAQPGSSLTAEATNRYFVHFGEAGALHYQGGIPGLPRTAAPDGEFDARTDGVVAYRDYLEAQRTQYIGALQGVLGRDLEVSYHYDIFFNGVVIENLSGAEAALVAAQPNVSKVEVVKNYELSTDRVEAFIGAGAVWTGASTPSGTGSRGEGAVIAVIDTGVNTAAGHGSFTNVASCGHTGAQPKLIAKDCIGSSNCSGPTPQDSGHPHGSHTASTAGGNTHVATGGDLVGTQISGVAPCARLVTYKACPGQSCDGAALSAAAQTIMIDRPTLGITAVNYSISGGNSPWSDMDRNFLDMVNAGIFVAASAGNTSDAVPNPIGNVAHRGPWVATVANSTHDRISSNPVSVAGGPQNVPAIKSEAAFTSNRSGAIADSVALGNANGCTAGGGFPAGSMTGRIALINRGDCTFEEKGNNAIAAGAIGMIVANNNAGPPIVMGGTAAHSIPSVMISQSNGAAIRAHIGTNPTAVATMSSTTAIAIDPEAGDVLSAGSLRGPIPTIEATKPDITGPGTNIFAAYNNTANAYGFMSGTSMSGPHIAGAGALIKTVHPTWTNPEVKSAIQMTADKTGLKDFTNGTPNNGPWDADDVGHGRVDLTKAALAGLVLNETFANFVAANGSAVNQRALNLASMRNTSCTPSCTWTRTVRNTLGTASSWTATGASPNPNLNITVSPSSFSFPAGNTAATQTLTITATPTANLTAAVAFGEVVLSEAGDESPDLHLTVAIRGQGTGGAPVISVNPTSIAGTGTAGSPTPVVRPLAISNAGGAPLTWSEGTLVVNSRGTPTVVWNQPESGTNGIVSSFSTSLNSGAYTAADFVLTADTDLTEIKAFGFDPTNSLASQSAIRWAIYPDASGSPAGNPETNAGAALWTFSSPPGGAGVTIEPTGIITLNLTAAAQTVDLPAGTYWLSVFPTYAGDIQPAGAARWNWFQSEVQAGPSKLIAPGGLFGGAAPNWSATGAGGLGTAIQDTAFILTGVQGALECGAPWLSITPTSGTVAPGATGNVSVQLNASTLAAGTHTANLCIDSNDPANPTVIVPVSFEVGGGGGDGDADLALTVIDLPDPVEAGAQLTYSANLANFGPDAATDVEIVFELPAEVSFSHASTLAGAEKDQSLNVGGDWTCAGTGTVTCVLTSNIPSTSFAPVLQLVVDVSPTAAPGVITTTVTASSAENDPDPSDNSVDVETEVTGEKPLPDAIFCDGFEEGGDGSCGGGNPGDPDLVIIDDINFTFAPDFTGGAIKWVDGETCVCDTAPFNFNPYGTATTLQFFWPLNANGSEGGVSLDGSTYAVLQSGATISASSQFLVSTASTATAPWANTSGYLGFRFLDGGITKYGYAHFTAGASGRPFSIQSIAYNNVGDPVTIP